MAEKLSPTEQLILPDSIAYIKKWMSYDLQKMADESTLTAFYGHCELLMDEIDKLLGIEMTAMRILFIDTLARYKEIKHILFPKSGIYETTEKFYFSPEERISIRDNEVFAEVKTNELMLEFKELAQKLLDLLEDNDEMEEFQNMIGSKTDPVFEPVRAALEGALAIIKKFKNPHQDK